VVCFLQFRIKGLPLIKGPPIMRRVRGEDDSFATFDPHFFVFFLRVRRAREPLTPAVCWGRLEKMAASREKGRNTCTETATHDMC